MPKGYLIANVTVNDPEEYAGYTGQTPALMERFGGKYIVRGGRAQVPEGESRERQVVIEFPSYENAVAAYNDDEYQKVADIRRRATDSTIILVEGA
ncbi:DUF1330 domain-containing protein [Roseobacter sp.]|uniref:DUF1330 domain-containing protein n=1 Tax=Roseobacter sp. TaxID=1907202 RepID=UPI0025DC446A|nr:DUF1330 domain-containing protein [Roseobacter sp.]